MNRVLSILLLLIVNINLIPHSKAQFGAEDFTDLQARSIGPAGMSGRVTALDADVNDPNTIYVGAATGGLWKSTDGALSWTPIFDDQRVCSIGAIAIHPKVSDIVWVGTGEGYPRNSVSVGNGVFRSLDGGRSWESLGLEGTERIPRVILHPTDTQTAYVAALGPTWGESSNRGVYKTIDGGSTWVKILYVDERTGAADMIMDPRNPEKLMVSMWDHRRWPYSFRSGGPGSGLYVTLNGGDDWNRLGTSEGLPSGELGRIGLAVSKSHPQTVYALVEAKKSVLLRSDDGGLRFRTVNDDQGISDRPFYYSTIRVDPEFPNRIYKLGSVVTYSEDGGASFNTLIPYNAIHPDHHAMWIHPDDGNTIIEGNDGGVAVSRDRGQTWRFVTNLPLAQYYHIQVDMEKPYNVYGGMQDNGSWRGPSTVWENGGIRNHHWDEVGFGDGFNTVPDPEDSMTGYAMSQEGYLSRWDLRTGERRDIRPQSPDADVALRFNWDAAFALDPFDSGTLYFGSQFVHKSTDRGSSWTAISGDLTTNNANWQKQGESGGLTFDVTGAENYTCIMEIAPSPVEPNVLWVGTDDGRVQWTRDGGESWTSVESHIFDVPKNTWVSHIEASKFDAGTAFVLFDDHRRNNWTPYVFKTSDFGETWVNLATESIWGYALSIEQDSVAKDLLFLGTEFGLYVSVDGGQAWTKWNRDYPTVSTMALLVHPRESDLVVGTHGRAAYIIDDISPLREWSAATQKKALHVFPIKDAQQHRFAQTGASRFPGVTEFRGDTRRYGAFIHFSVADVKSPGKIEILISDSDGEEIQTLKPDVHKGINRVVWNLRQKPFEDDDEGASRNRFRSGPEVIPGTYTVKVTYGDDSISQSLEVLENPDEPISLEDRKANFAFQRKASELSRVLGKARTSMVEVDSEVNRILSLIKATQGRLKREKGEDSEDVHDEARDEESEAGESEVVELTDEVEVELEGEVEGSTDEADDEDPHVVLKKKAEALQKSVKALRDRLSPGSEGMQGIIRRQGLQSEVGSVSGSLFSLKIAPTPNHHLGYERARAKLESFLDDLNAIYEKDLAEFRELVHETPLDLVAPRESIQLDKQ